MKYIPGLPTEAPAKGQLVSIDLELFNMEADRLHRPHGDFAYAGIAFGKKAYVVDNLPDLKRALRIVSRGLWVMHNATFDIRQLRRWRSVARRPVWDTMLVERVLYNGYFSHFALDDLARRYFSKKLKKGIRDTFGEGVRRPAIQMRYTAEDAWYTLKIAELQQKLLKDEGLEHIYWEVDEPTIWAILDMPPVKVDVAKWIELSKSNQAEAAELEEELGINSKSPQQVINKAAELGLHLPNTQKATLLELSDHPFVAGVLNARMYRDAVSRYGEKWLRHAEKDGLVYANFRVTGAETGRMSCARPNLQQIPVARMPVFRTLFIPKTKDGTIVVADVAQQEPRILCYMTKDANLLKAFRSGEDIHLYVTREIFQDQTIEEGDKRKLHGITMDARDLGKDINLGTSYGLTAYGLAERTNLDELQAERVIQQYFKRFPRVAAWIPLQRNRARSRGYIETALGRRIYINPYNREWANNAINAPIQGGAADHTKKALVRVWEVARARDLPFCVTMVIHDELVADVPKGLVREYKTIIRSAWLDVAKEIYPGVPFKADVLTGKSWGCK